MKGAGSWPVEGLHGWALLGARGSGFVVFGDWEPGAIVRRIGADADSGSRGQSHTCCSPEPGHADSCSRGQSNDRLTEGKHGKSGLRGQSHTRREPAPLLC